jgi:hypothetical protein
VRSQIEGKSIEMSNSKSSKQLVILPKHLLKPKKPSTSNTEKISSVFVQQHFASLKPKKKWWISTEEKSLLVSTDQPWYKQLLPLDDGDASKDAFYTKKVLQLSDEIFPFIEASYKTQVDLYNKILTETGNANDLKWLNSVIRSGTWSDKIAALTLKIQENGSKNNS